MNITDLVHRNLELTKQGKGGTLLGIGPMSEDLIRASLELARDDDFPIMFIASRNQVDSDEFGAGYVNGWNQERFARDISRIAEETNFLGDYYLCRDHGGPWQRDEERNQHLPLEEAMERAKKSYKEDLLAGFDLLMIDPTKDPFEIGKVIPLETVINLTIELIEYCEEIREEYGLPPVGYEVGTEETNGGLTTTQKYREFIDKLTLELDQRKLPTPIFIVGQTGTLTRLTEQVGTFNYHNAKELSSMAIEYNVGLKEHNGDYLSDEILLLHTPSNVTAVNVAPQYGTVETRALVKLTKVEKNLMELGELQSSSNLFNLLLHKAIESKRWKKWLNKEVQYNEIMNDEELALQILDIAGHYTFNDKEILSERKKLYENLEKFNIDAERFVIEEIKVPIKQYVTAFNLKDLNKRIG